MPEAFGKFKHHPRAFKQRRHRRRFPGMRQDVYKRQLLLVHDGTTCELLYSGLNEKYRRYLAAYALRCRGIQWAFEQGLSLIHI